MAAFIDTRIVEALCEHLGQLSPRYPVQWPDVKFEPPTESDGHGGTRPAPYLRASFMPAEITSSVGHGSNIHRGLFQVDVFYPRGQGLPNGMEVAGSIKEWFARNTNISRESANVRIVKEPSIGTPIEEDKLLHIPVRVTYFSTTPNT